MRRGGGGGGGGGEGGRAAVATAKRRGSRSISSSGVEGGVEGGSEKEGGGRAEVDSCVQREERGKSRAQRQPSLRFHFECNFGSFDCKVRLITYV
jgi:hypothetical protein